MTFDDSVDAEFHSPSFGISLVAIGLDLAALEAKNPSENSHTCPEKHVFSKIEHFPDRVECSNVEILNLRIGVDKTTSKTKNHFCTRKMTSRYLGFFQHLEIFTLLTPPAREYNASKDPAAREYNAPNDPGGSP